MPCKPDFKNRTPEEKRRMKRTIAAIIAFVAFLAITCVLVGRPLLKFIDDPQKFRDWVDTHGIWGRLSFVGMMALQVIVAFIPGEPLEIAAGYAFGVWEGTGLCMLGALIGGLVVFLFVRSFGRRAAEVFFPPEQIDSVRFLRAGRELNFGVLPVLYSGYPEGCDDLLHWTHEDAAWNVAADFFYGAHPFCCDFYHWRRCAWPSKLPVCAHRIRRGGCARGSRCADLPASE